MTSPTAGVTGAAVARSVGLRRWVLACTAAEAIGMTAASAAAWFSRDLAPAPALTVVVAGGLVEGTALGVLQARALSPWLGARARLTWTVVTILVAGLGWAAASVPGVLADDSGDAPPLVLVLAGAVGLGAVMGALLGAAQATALRHAVRRPWRWVRISAFAWALTMPVIFLGATRPDASWGLPAVLATGVVTGVVAGTVLGGASGVLLPRLLGGVGLRELAVMRLLTTRWRALLPTNLVGLGVTGRRTGVVRRFPVQVASLHGYLVVLPGRHERKQWWRNVQEHPDVEVLRNGVWLTGVASVVRPGDRRWLEAHRVYHAALPHARIVSDDLWVLVDLRLTRRAD